MNVFEKTLKETEVEYPKALCSLRKKEYYETPQAEIGLWNETGTRDV
jgi:hypothetical protein